MRSRIVAACFVCVCSHLLVTGCVAVPQLPPYDVNARFNATPVDEIDAQTVRAIADAIPSTWTLDSVATNFLVIRRSEIQDFDSKRNLLLLAFYDAGTTRAGSDGEWRNDVPPENCNQRYGVICIFLPDPLDSPTSPHGDPQCEAIWKMLHTEVLHLGEGRGTSSISQR